MNDDLTALRTSANEMRSGEARAFDGEFTSFNGEKGAWRAGKNKTDMDGRRLTAAVMFLIVAWQKFKDGKAIYAGARYVRDGHQLPLREQLDERNSNYWEKTDRDPWQTTWYLALFDDETREQFVWSTNSDGGKDALSTLQDAFADHNEGRALEDYESPIVELGSDWYINSYKKKIFKPILDIVGWCKVPTVFRLPRPPANSITLRVIEHKPGEPKQSSSDDDPSDQIPF